MAEDDKFSVPLAESLLTLLAFDKNQGNVVAGFVAPDLFEQPLRDIAERVLAYRLRYKQPPGKEHVDDLFDHVLSDPKNRLAPVYQRILQGMLSQAEGLNAPYVASRVTEFVRRQRLKQALVRAGQVYQAGADNAAEEVERILLDALRFQGETLDPGTFLSDRNRALSFITNPTEPFAIGIKELDRRGIGPTRKEMDLFVAPRKRGKSWKGVHTAKQGLLQRLKVLIVTLEMSEERYMQRMFMALFAIAKRDEKFTQTKFELDELGRLTGFDIYEVRPTLNFRDPRIKAKLVKLMNTWGTRIGDNLLIKEFPSGSLTIEKYRSYLDYLDSAHHFVPDIVIVDYPDLMKIDMRNPRQSLGRVFVDLRGEAVERNHALSTMTQSNRPGETAKSVESVHVSEDISKVATADAVTTYSQTKDEKALGLARLYVNNARGDKDGFTVLISQSYDTGQFVTDSAPFGSMYWDRVKEQFGGRLSGDEKDNDDEHDEREKER